MARNQKATHSGNRTLRIIYHESPNLKKTIKTKEAIMHIMSVNDILVNSTEEGNMKVHLRERKEVKPYDIRDIDKDYKKDMLTLRNSDRRKDLPLVFKGTRIRVIEVDKNFETFRNVKSYDAVRRILNKRNKENIKTVYYEGEKIKP